VHVGVGGYAADAPDDPMQIVTSGLDQPVFPGPVSKDRREDLQIWGAADSLARQGLARHPLAIDPGDDPPDRYLRHDRRTWGTELTELTFEHVRNDLAPVRAIGRQLEERLRARPTDFEHLKGRVVAMFALPDRPLPEDREQLLNDLEAVLEEDKGYAGQGLDFSQGPPAALNSSGLYGDHGPFHVIANPSPGGTDIVVSASTSTRLYRSEVLAALARRAAAKDHAGNEILVVTCGLPDTRGYSCPADLFLFRMLLTADAEGIDLLPVKPTHIKGVLIHSWGSSQVICWGEGDDLPWVQPRRMPSNRAT
jgi:hypothetical protein